MLIDILSRNRNLTSLTFCVSFSILCIVWQSNPFAQGVGYFGKVADRISGALSSGLRFTGTLWVELDQYRELEQRYENAQKAIEEFRLEKDKFDLLQAENAQLRTALGFSPAGTYKEVRAEVLGIRLNSISPRIIIDKGSEDGIRPLMPVLTRAHDLENNLVRCVVGVVAAVDSSTAIIQPLTHPGFRMGVRIQGSSEWAIMSGNSGRVTQVQLQYLTANHAPEQAILARSNLEYKKNDYVVSSGEGGIFPRGIPVGVIDEEGPRDGEFRTAYVTPLAPISNLDIVSIVLKAPEKWAAGWEQKERWEEHLDTEFGPPVYFETTETRRKPKPAPRQTAPAQTNANNGAANANPGSESAATPAAGDNSGEAGRKPRRIQNLDLPGQN
ncbi:MAG: rod shape-determining protein MreC [bacterium]|nr:rod shape-determining protein MreC [bacterium]